MDGGEKILGVEGGGTKTSWVLVERTASDLRVLDQGKLPAANFRLATGEDLQVMFRRLPQEIVRAGVFLAGCATHEDRETLIQIMNQMRYFLPHLLALSTNSPFW